MRSTLNLLYQHQSTAMRLLKYWWEAIVNDLYAWRQDLNQIWQCYVEVKEVVKEAKTPVFVQHFLYFEAGIALPWWPHLFPQIAGVLFLATIGVGTFYFTQLRHATRGSMFNLRKGLIWFLTHCFLLSLVLGSVMYGLAKLIRYLSTGGA
jgi:hypothetical protein